MKDRATQGFVDVWRLFTTAFPGGWSRDDPGMLSYATGTVIPFGNGAMVWSSEASAEVLRGRLDDIAGTCAGMAVQGPAEVIDAIAPGGFQEEDARPLMVVDALPDLADPAGLRVQEAAEDLQPLFLDVVAEGFEAPVAAFADMMRPSVFALPGTRAYLGYVDGIPVGGSLGVTLGDVVAIFSVGTPPTHRGKGYGAALTAAAVRDGFAHGASYAVLQASVMGYPVYKRMGFETVDTWKVLVQSRN